MEPVPVHKFGIISKLCTWLPQWAIELLLLICQVQFSADSCCSVNTAVCQIQLKVVLRFITCQCHNVFPWQKLHVIMIGSWFSDECNWLDFPLGWNLTYRIMCSVQYDVNFGDTCSCFQFVIELLWSLHGLIHYAINMLQLMTLFHCCTCMCCAGWAKSKAAHVPMADHNKFLAALFKALKVDRPLIISASMSGSFVVPYMMLPDAQSCTERMSAFIPLAPVATARFSHAQYHRCEVCFYMYITSQLVLK